MHSSFFTILYALALFSAPFLLFGCGDDDDDNDSVPVQADDDSDDDISTDDDAADDDAGDDDADDDDDTAVPDYTREPLAVLNADAAFAEPGASVFFDGASSVDPNARPLAYLLDFGDGQTTADSSATHAFSDPGAYNVTLTVTNDEGYSDSSSRLVQVGAFPSTPADFEGIDFKPNFFIDDIIERDPPPFAGGVVYGFFTSPDAATADTILINGQAGHPDSSFVEWCELLPAELLPPQVGVVQCHAYSELFEPGNTVSFEIKAGGSTLWSYNAVIPDPTISPTYIAANVAGDELLVYARNDGDADVLLTGLAIDGRDVSDFVAIENDMLAPDEMGLIRAPRHDGIDYGVFHVFTVLGSTESAEVSASRVHRLFHPVFPVGNWDSGDDNIYHNMESLDRQLDHGVDMHIYYPSAENPPDLVVPLAEEKDFYLFTHRGGDSDPTYEQYIADYGDSPSVLANAVFGEPDLNDEAIKVIPEMQLQRGLWGTKKPLWGYNACAHRWPSFQPLPDIGGMDHYCVFAPKCNYNWPPFLWDHLWFEGYYAESAKRNSEPKPVWDWTQGNNWGDLYLFNRCLTDEEIRAQWYVLVGRGLKGMLWFRFTEEWNATCPGPMPEMKRLAHELDIVKPYLLEGEWFTTGKYLTTPDETIDTQATIGPRGAVLVFTNFHYTLNLIMPWVWHEKIDISVDFMPPAGFEPVNFQRVDDGELIDLEWRKIADGHWRFNLPSLTVAEMILVTPEP